MITPWRIELFGHLAVVRDGERIERFRRGIEARLLAFLAANLMQNHPRERLIEWLWPDKELASGRASLRVALAALRRRLEPPNTPYNSVLVTDRAMVRLNPALVVTDVQEFEAAVKEAEKHPDKRIGHLEQAAAVYRGELLPGNLDDWARDERERLAQIFRELLSSMARTLADRGELGRAITYALQVVTAEPLDEQACLTLMHLHAQAGQAHLGLKVFDKLRLRLRKDVGQKPSSEAQKLAKQLRTDPHRFVIEISPRVLQDDASLGPASSHILPGSSLPQMARRLPCPTTRFFGREEETDSLILRFGQDACRLVTLTGPPGAGKTRLAIHTAWRLPVSETGRVWFVSLADTAEADQILLAILAVLGSNAAASEDALERIVGSLSGPPTLLVLDNFEHLVDEGALVVLGLLERLPGLTCLVTSRRSLNLPGEHIRDVPALPLPEPGDTLEQLAERPRVRLFVDRAQAKSPEFQLTARNQKAVIELVCGLEGIPLALEMAAVWIQVRTPARMVIELESRYRLLNRNLKGVPARHKTLHSAVAWSYDLLSPAAKHFLPYLSVFRGSWTQEAAAAIGLEPEAEGLLAELQEHSWITGEDDGGRMRFQILKTLQEFALQQMNPVYLNEIGGRHADYYGCFYDEAKYHLDGPDQRHWLEEVTTEWENISAAVHWRLANDASPERVLRLTADLCRFCEIRGYLGIGRSFLEAALAKQGNVSATVRGPTLNSAGWLAFVQGDYAIAFPHFEGALKAAWEAASRKDESIALGNLGLYYEVQSRYDEAASCFEKSGGIAREIGSPLFEANARGNLANLLKSRGRYAEACIWFQECVGLFEALGNHRSEAIAWINMADAFCQAGHFAEARMPYRRALEISHGLRDRWLLAACFEGLASGPVLAGTRMEEGRRERGVRLLAAAARLRRELGISEHETSTRLHRLRQQELGEALFLRLWGEGQEGTLDEAVQWGQEEASVVA